MEPPKVNVNQPATVNRVNPRVPATDIHDLMTAKLEQLNREYAAKFEILYKNLQIVSANSQSPQEFVLKASIELNLFTQLRTEMEKERDKLHLESAGLIERLRRDSANPASGNAAKRAIMMGRRMDVINLRNRQLYGYVELKKRWENRLDQLFLQLYTDKQGVAPLESETIEIIRFTNQQTLKGYVFNQTIDKFYITANGRNQVVYKKDVKRLAYQKQEKKIEPKQNKMMALPANYRELSYQDFIKVYFELSRTCESGISTPDYLIKACFPKNGYYTMPAEPREQQAYDLYFFQKLIGYNVVDRESAVNYFKESGKRFKAVEEFMEKYVANPRNHDNKALMLEALSSMKKS